MNKALIDGLRHETEALDALGIAAYAVERFGDKVALASSLGAEDQALTDMLVRVTPRPHIFSLDTGRLPQETYDTIEATRKRYGIAIDILFPNRADVEDLVRSEGPNCFYRSVELRRRCCRIRKVVPLQRKLATLDAWMTGLRREQSPTRAEVHRIEWDEANGLIKINPLANWSAADVWDYIKQHGVPCNPLHAQGYPSLGCAPCTRAVKPGEDERAGRWWWESPQQKECGLHVKDGKLVRKKG